MEKFDISTWFSKKNAIFYLSILISLGHIFVNTTALFRTEWVSAAHFASLGFLYVLMKPTLLNFDTSGRWLGKLIDVIIAFGVIASAVYLILFTDALYQRGTYFNSWDWFFSIIALVLAFELARRTTGWFIPIVSMLAILYIVKLGAQLDHNNVFHFPGLSWEIALQRVYFGVDGMFGSIANISWSFVFIFILLGAFLTHSGGSKFILDLSLAIGGRFVGGSGFVAVISSGLMGSISGSAIANAASTGIITIPMMKKTGFKGEFAAGVEAAASTGGQIMPPIMGAGAFVMASTTQIPYTEIVAASIVPAILYFASVLFFVRVNAKKNNVSAIPRDQLPSLSSVLKKGWYHLVPFAVLIALLSYGLTPTYAAIYTILSVVFVGFLSPEKMRFSKILQALSDGSRSAVTVSMLLVIIGVLVISINTTGIGNIFSLMIMEWSGGSLLFALVLIALASLILGMGLPVTASYIILGALCAPLIYNFFVDQYIIDALLNGSISDGALGILSSLNPDISAANKVFTLEQAQALVAPFSKAENSALRGILTEQAVSAGPLSVMLLTAHLIIFWLSQDSNVTPPVCLVAYTTASIANASTSKTAFSAWKIAKGLYLIPLLMAYLPLIGQGFWSAFYYLLILLPAMYGAVVLFERYSESDLKWYEYLMVAVFTGSIFMPHHNMMIDIISVAGILIVLLFSVKKSRLEFA